MFIASNKRHKTLWQALKPDWDSIETVLPEGKGLALDLGAGSGRHRGVIEKAGYRYISCDYSQTATIQLRVDAHHLPFANETFDLVNIWQVIEFLHNPWLAMREIHRVLKPGGVIIGSVSYLEPMQGDTFFYFTYNGLTEILKGSEFNNIFISPGISCFPLIYWTWMRQLTGNRLLMKGALWGARISTWCISFVFDILSAAKHAFGLGHNFKRKWLREVMPLRYAGQITFRATKGENI